MGRALTRRAYGGSGFAAPHRWGPDGIATFGEQAREHGGVQQRLRAVVGATRVHGMRGVAEEGDAAEGPLRHWFQSFMPASGWRIPVVQLISWLPCPSTMPAKATFSCG